LGKPLRIREFAALAGVTAKALRHYDRLGLLKPRRSETGYRLYGDADLARLEEIVALKFLGFPLRRIGRLLEGGPRPLADVLRTQRAALEGKRQMLDRAITAIEDAERLIASGATSNTAALRRLIEVIEMQNGSKAVERYFSDEAWKRMTQIGRRYRRPPRSRLSAAWRDLFHEVEGMLGEDPASDRAQEAGTRWVRLWESTTGGDTAVRSGLRAAWADRRNWPPALRRAWEGLRVEEVGGFMTRVLQARMKRSHEARMKKYYTSEAWAKKAALERPELTEAWKKLYRDVGEALEGDPRSKKALALARRWRRLAGLSTGGDRGIVKGAQKAWKDRPNWPLPARRHVEQSRLPEMAAWIGKAMRELRRR